MTENERQANNLVTIVDLYTKGFVSAEELMRSVYRRDYLCTEVPKDILLTVRAQ